MTKQELRNLVIGMVLGSMGLSALAAVSIPHSFSPNTTIKSSEVNANFAALGTAIDGKQDRVTGQCATGSAVRTINADGSVICESTGGFALPFTGSIGAGSPAAIALNVSSSTGKTAVKGLGGNYGVVGDTLETSGVGVLAANSAGNGSAALEIAGGVKVSGANKPAFVHQAAAGNSLDNYTCINNPLTNNRPNAVVIVTQNFNPNGTASGVYNNSPVGVYYGTNPSNAVSNNKWCIFNQVTSASIPPNASFNVLVFNQ